jgi:hypothetical protein
VYSLYGKTTLICSQGLTFLKYFQDALNVECVKFDGQDQFNNVLKIESNKTLDDYLNLNSPNSNEYTLGIMGEYDPSDLVATDKVINDFFSINICKYFFGKNHKKCILFNYYLRQ